MHVESTMHLEMDFGHDVGLGDPIPQILVLATDVHGSSDGIDFDYGDRPVSFRLTDDRSIETLVDLKDLDMGLTGTVLVTLHPDATVGLREPAGEWHCDTEGSDPCELVP